MTNLSTVSTDSPVTASATPSRPGSFAPESQGVFHSPLARVAWPLILLIFPLAVQLVLVDNWSLDADEYYTLVDSALPLGEVLRYQSEIVLYYLTSHFMLALPLSQEVAIRLPAAIACGLVPITLYILIARTGNRRWAVIAGLLALSNAWLLELGQFARYYSFVCLFSAGAAFSFYRYVQSGSRRWLVAFGACAVLATWSHTPAGVLFPAAVLAILATRWRKLRAAWQLQSGRRKAVLAVGICAALIVLAWFGYRPYQRWSSAAMGQYGNYATLELVIGLIILSGPQLWALAWPPLLARGWMNREDVALLWLLGGCVVPLLLLNPFGGGIAIRYLVVSLPIILLVASRNLARILDRIVQPAVQVGLVLAIMTFSLPSYLSNALDGNHYDMRAAHRFVQQLELDNPIIGCSTHGIYLFYNGWTGEAIELGKLGYLPAWDRTTNGAPSETLGQLVAEAQDQQRPLVLISAEDRVPLDPHIQQWLGEHFAIVQVIETPRYDHRRNRLVIYQFRQGST